MKKNFLLWLSILFIYLLFAGRGIFQFHTTQRNFFSLQAYSWLQGRFDLAVLPNDITDLSIYKGKAYMYYPPLPAVFALPFVVVFGVGVSDVFYTAFYSSIAPVFLYLMLQKAKKAKLIPQLSDNYLIILTLFFAFGTVFFYLSLLGTVWFTSQILAILTLIISLYFLFSFAYDKKQNSFVLSVILLCLSFWGRLELILAFPLYFYLLFITKNPKKTKIFFIILSILFLNFAIYFVYNYFQFNNFFESGLNYIQNDPRFIEQKRIGFFNFKYLLHNSYYFLINPLKFKTSFPFIYPDPEGNSMFSTSPLFILLFGLLSKKLFSKKVFFISINLFLSGVIALLFLFYGSTGWFQFGYRYALDVIPLLILALAFVIGKFPKSVVVGLFLLSVAINVMGAIWMLQLAPYLNY